MGFWGICDGRLTDESTWSSRIREMVRGRVGTVGEFQTEIIIGTQ